MDCNHRTYVDEDGWIRCWHCGLKKCLVCGSTTGKGYVGRGSRMKGAVGWRLEPCPKCNPLILSKDLKNIFGSINNQVVNDCCGKNDRD